MEYQFSTEEISQIVRSARVLAPGFTKEEFQELVSSQRQLADSGFYEAAWGMVQLQQEKGISCPEAIDVYKQLLRDKAQLESELASLQEGIARQRNKNREAEAVYQRMKEGIKHAREELKKVQNEQQKEERVLLAFRKKAAREKRRIEEEVEECRQEAKVTEEDISAAGRLKAELESRDFSLELVLDLSQEFIGCEDVREELAEALEKHRTLTEYLANLNEVGEGQKRTLKSELDDLKSQHHREQAEVKKLTEARNQLEIALSNLRTDAAHEEEIRRFYQRYYGNNMLLEYLASWTQVFFLRCNNLLCAPFSGVTHFWTDKSAVKCPHCGLNMLNYDVEIYQSLNWPVGTPIKLQLGE